MKYYLQNLLGNNEKRVMATDTPEEAVKIFVESILLSQGNIEPIVFVSEAGFISDLYEFEMIDAVDDSQTFSTAKALRSLAEDYEDEPDLNEEFLRLATELEDVTEDFILEVTTQSPQLADVIREMVDA